MLFICTGTRLIAICFINFYSSNLVQLHNKRLKHRGLRPLDSQQVVRRLGGR